MSRATLLGLMGLIEGGAGIFLLLSPDIAHRLLLGGALPGLTETGMQVLGLCLLGIALLCLAGVLRSGLPQPFAIMLAYNVLAAAGLVGIAILGGPAGPLLWPAILLHGALAGLQLRSRRST
jgi:hypothetical protein